MRDQDRALTGGGIVLDDVFRAVFRAAVEGAFSSVVNAAPPRIQRAGPNRFPAKALESKMRFNR